MSYTQIQKNQVFFRTKVRPKFAKKEEDQCWKWYGMFTTDGYGRVYKEGIEVRVHRLAYEYYYKVNLDVSVPVTHNCGMKSCMNPKHLILGFVEEELLLNIC